MSIMFFGSFKKKKKRKKLLHRRHEIQGQVSPPVYTVIIMKKENRILHMPISNVSIERMDLETK